MSEILLLARDYLERMANPIYGASINEDYAIRFATLLRSEGFEGRLNKEISEIEGRTTLTSHGWHWVLGWAKSRQLDLSEDLLVELFEEWSSVFLRAEIIDLAIQNADYSRQYIGRRLDEFPSPFLVKIMSSATRAREEDVRRAEDTLIREDRQRIQPNPPTSMAESTLIALLQVGRPITLDAASVFLRHIWGGQQQLLYYFWATCDGLDSETRDAWVNRLRPPNAERG